MQRPLAFTVEYEEEWHADFTEAWFVLKANGHEVHRGYASVGNSDGDDAEEWAANLLSKVIEAALEAEREMAPHWEERV